MQNLITYFSTQPKRLFLLDSIGALATAASLAIILLFLNTHFAIPSSALHILIAVALCFCIYSATCYLGLKSNFKPFLRIIATANLTYCLATLAMMFTQFSTLTLLAKAYLIIEVAIVCTLSYIEFSVAKKQ
ncbi:MAG: hypothetical protein RL660_1636 [Bacteroidota bacterium]|jgi:hypothetical protein